MNNVELKVLEVKLPEVLFNEKEISNYLEGVLEKYQGLVFTDDTVKDCKTTVSELNKMVKSVDSFRLKYKKELAAPISEFETKCKSLVTQIENVLDPLKAQADKFEADRRIARKVEVEGFIAECLTIVALEEKYASQLVLKDEWLNVSVSTPKLKKAIMEDVKKLESEQTAYYDKKEIVITKCENYSMKFGLAVALIPDNFYHLLDNKTGVELDERIYDIAQKNAEAEKVAMESIKIEAERKANAQAQETIRLAEVESKRVLCEQERLAKIESDLIKANAQAEVTAALEVAATVTQAVDNIIAVETTDNKMYSATFKVRGTKAQLEALVNYFEFANIQADKL